MKFLPVFFLAGLALASAIPLPSNDNALDKAVDDVDLWLNVALLAEDDDDMKTELGRKLHKHMDEILEKIKDAVDTGKEIKEDLIEKLKEIRQKLKDLRVDVSERAKEYIRKLKEKAKDYLKKVLEKFDKRDTDEPVTEMGKELKKQLDDLLAKIKDAIEHGSSLKDEYIQKLKELLQKFKEERIKISQKVRDFVKNLKNKGEEYLKKILERIGLDKRDADDEPKTELGKKLRKQLDEMLEKLRDAINNGKEVKQQTLDKLKEIREQLKDLKIDVSNRAKELLKDLKEKAKDYWNKLLEKLKPEKRSLSDSDALFAEQSKILERLEGAMNKLMVVIKDYLEKGKEVPESIIRKMKNMMEKMQGFGIDMKDKVGQALKEMGEKGQEIADRMGLNKQSFFAEEDDEPKTELGRKLKEHLDEILEKIKEAIERGKDIKEDTLEKVKEIRSKLRELKEDISKRAKELLQQIKEKGKNYLKQILEKLGLNKRAIEEHSEILLEQFAAEEEEKIAQKLREKFEEIVKKFTDAIRDGKPIKDLVERIRQLREQLKEHNIDLGEKVKELTGKIKNYFKELLEKLGKKEESAAQADLNLKDLLKKLKEHVISKFNPEDLKEMITKFFGKKSEIAEQLINKLKEKGDKAKQKILDFIDRILGDKEERSIKDVYEKIKNYFKELQIDLKEKFTKFGEWAKAKYEQGLEKGRDRAENMKKLAREFIHDTKVISKDVAEQAKEFFKEYKDDLGAVYEDVKEKVREILGKQ